MTKEEFENLPVGETFVCGNKKIIVKLAETDTSCKGCIFYHSKNYSGSLCVALEKIGAIPECDILFRKDGNSVVFVEVKDEISL